MARPHDVSTKRIGRPIYTYAAMYVNECTYITFTCRHTRTKTCTAANAYTRRIYVVPPIWPDIHVHTRWMAMDPVSVLGCPGARYITWQAGGTAGASHTCSRVTVHIHVHVPRQRTSVCTCTYTSCLLAAPLHELRRTGTARTNTTHNTHHTRQAACVQGSVKYTTHGMPGRGETGMQTSRSQ